jgi:phage tail sheath protein FI
MPEYLSPDVYVEEVSFRSPSIEAVSTSTTGFAGMAAYGPVTYPGGPKTSEPRVLGSFTEYERVYGGIPNLFANTSNEQLCYLGHATRAFFLNLGQILYIARVFAPGGTQNNPDWGIASQAVAANGISATWRARWPGAYGNVLVQTAVVRSKNVAYTDRTLNLIQAQRAKAGAVVEIFPASTPNPPKENDTLDLTKLAVVQVDVNGKQTFIDRNGNQVVPANTDAIQLVEMTVTVNVNPERIDVYDQLGADPAQKRYIAKILQKDNPEDEDAVVWLDWDPTQFPLVPAAFIPALLMATLQANTSQRLSGGNDGSVAQPTDLAGQPADPDHPEIKATGLEALGEIDDIAIVALPDSGTYDDPTICMNAAGVLIDHAEALQYRIAVVDAPKGSSMNQVRAFRGQFDSTRAALYHPWIEIMDPTQRPAQGAPPPLLLLPASGFITGIYARTDDLRGVFKAPANEVVMGLTQFESNITKTRQDVLNPEGINALRFFPDRGYRVWGARTMSSDPEWKYVNVRRLFNMIEHSIVRGTQYAVFEPNNPILWAKIRQSIEDFLLVQWRDGALIGDTPDKAYFVRCDRTTMTQNDLDNGRMIALVGIAPTYPAEFVIIRIGQFTADAA